MPAPQQRAHAKTTYTVSADGTFTFTTWLKNLTSATAINSTDPAVTSLITDGSWSTGIFNLGAAASPATGPNNGALAGDIGGLTYSSSNRIVLIAYATGAVEWGESGLSDCC